MVVIGALPGIFAWNTLSTALDMHVFSEQDPSLLGRLYSIYQHRTRGAVGFVDPYEAFEVVPPARQGLISVSVGVKACS